jgi:hypothetical protein
MNQAQERLRGRTNGGLSGRPILERERDEPQAASVGMKGESSLIPWDKTSKPSDWRRQASGATPNPCESTGPVNNHPKRASEYAGRQANVRGGTFSKDHSHGLHFR